MRRLLLRLGLAAIIAATAFTCTGCVPAAAARDGYLGVADLVRPQQPASGIVFLFSGLEGYTPRPMPQTARATRGRRRPGRRHRPAARPSPRAQSADDCVYFVTDIEELSQLIQRSAGAETYLNPDPRGPGVGGSMVLALVAQSPLATIGRAVAVDPGADLPLPQELCSDAPHRSRPPTGRAGSMACNQGSFPLRSPSSRRRRPTRQGRRMSPI